jgi:hypothetical protein
MVFEPVQDIDLNGSGYFLDCADGNVRQCYPIIAARIADCIEHVVIAGMISRFCPVCEILKNALSDESSTTLQTDRLSTNEYPQRVTTHVLTSPLVSQSDSVQCNQPRIIVVFTIDQ